MSRRLLLVVWMGLAAAARAAAGPVVFMPLGGDRALQPGEVVEVRWAGAPWGVEEMELLLSVDGGRHFGVRITPDLEADRRVYTWRVPPFRSDDARLAIRVDLAGREVLAGVSDSFRIAAEPAAGAAAPAYRWPMRLSGGELWVTGYESVGADPAGPFEPAPAASHRGLVPGRPGPAAAIRRSPRPSPPPPSPLPAAQADPGAPSPVAVRAAGQKPPFVPLRI